MSTKRERQCLEFLEDFERLSRKDTDAIGWIALKFSITRAQAEHLIIDATTPDDEEETK